MCLALSGLSQEHRAGWAGSTDPEQTAIERVRLDDRPRELKRERTVKRQNMTMHLDNLRYIFSHHAPDETGKFSGNSSFGNISAPFGDEHHANIFLS